MTEAPRRLRAADPASSLPPQPDTRAEADLRVLLAEPQSVSAVPHRVASSRRFGPVLVTGLVAIVVVAITAAVLGVVEPRTDQAAPPASPTSAPSTISPPYQLGGCRPAEVLPFQCGTYRSVYGADAITGNTGGPAKDHLSLSFTTQHGVLLLRAQTDSCFAGVLPVRYDGKALVGAGEPLFGEASGCSGPGTNDKKNWAYAFLTGPLVVSPGGGLAFNTAKSLVTFDYEGSADIGEPQLPRNDATCITAHVEPFSCGDYRSSGGTGTLAFLGSSPYRLGFHHLNGELTAGLMGDCNSIGVSFQPDSSPAGLTIVAIPGGSTAMGCMGDRGTHDEKISDFFDGVLTYRITGDTITFTKGSSSATFTRSRG